MNVKPINLSGNPPLSSTGSSGAQKASGNAAPPVTQTLYAQNQTGVMFDAVTGTANPNTCTGLDVVRQETPEQFIANSAAKIQKLLYTNDGENPSITTLRKVLSTDKNPQRHANRVSMLGEDYLLTWLFARGIGQSAADLRQSIHAPEAEVLSAAISNLQQGSNAYAAARRSFWWPQLSLILSSELEDPALRQQLTHLLSGINGWQAETEPKKQESLALEQLYNQYLKDKESLSLFTGENLYRRAMYKKSLGTVSDNPEYRALLFGGTINGVQQIGAKQYIERLATLETITPDFSARNLSKEKKAFVPGKVLSISRELRKHIAWANLWMANVLMQEAEDIHEPAAKLQILQTAEKYLKNTAPLDGTPLIEARRVLAENLIQQGYLQKHQGGNYVALFRQALCHLNYIEAWQQDFVARIGQNAVLPRWVANISASITLARTKLTMSLAGELDQRPVRELIRDQFSASTWALLESGPSKSQLLIIQQELLQQTAAKLELYINEAPLSFYTYKNGPQQTKVNLFTKQEIIDLRVALAENLARRAFIAKELGTTGAQDLFNRARAQLAHVLDENGPANKLSRTMANLWMAKIIFVESGERPTKAEILAALAPAKAHIEKALAAGKLHDTLLSYAYQTQGEILLIEENLANAETAFKQALNHYPQNLEAKVNLADLYSQLGNHSEAAQHYNEVIATATSLNHPIRDRAYLGLLETEMRKEESYDDKQISDLETHIFRLFNSEPAGSFLLLRAIDDLIEAYSTNEDLHKQIVLLACSLLTSTCDVPKGLEVKGRIFSDLKQRLTVNHQSLLPARFQAKLYLKYAEALSWLREYPAAEDLLNKNIPNNLDLQIIQRDPDLKAAKTLLNAEIKMRAKKDGQYLLGAELLELIKQTQDPDLTARYIIDLTEAHAYDDNFAEIIKTVQSYLQPDNPLQVAGRFMKKGRHLGYDKFSLTLKKKMVDALFWDKKYEAALNEAADLLKAIEVVRRDHPLLGTFLNILKAQSQVTRGDIYLADKKDKLAQPDYQQAIESLKRLPKLPARAKVTLAEAWLGLAELHRYGEELKNLEAAPKYYHEAEMVALTLPAGSDERARLLARIYLGRAKLAEMQGDTNAAYQLIKKAVRELDRLAAPAGELASEINNAYNERAAQAGSLLTSNYTLFNGGDGATESQLILGFNLSPLSLSQKYGWLRLSGALQMDLGPNTSNYTGYAGFSWLPMPAMSINTQLKLGTSGDGYEMVYFRRPAYKFNFFWWDKHFTVGLAANINDYNFKRDSELNTYNASAMVNFAWTNSKWSQGLRLGLNYDYFAFTLMGGFQPRHQPGFGIRYELPITDWWKVQVNALALLYSSEQKTDLGLGQYKYSTSWDGGAEIGLETQFNINRYLRLRLAYSRQQTAQYPINLFRGYLEAAY